MRGDPLSFDFWSRYQGQLRYFVCENFWARYKLDLCNQFQIPHISLLMIRGGVLMILGQFDKKKFQPKEPLLFSITQDYPWQIVATDLLTLDGKDHFVVVDYYSRFFEVLELTCTLSKVVIHKLKSNIRSLRNTWKGRFRQWPPVLLSRICNLCKRVQLHTLHPAPTTHNSMDWPTNVCKQLKRYLKSQTWQPGPLLGFTSLPCNSPRHRLFPCWAHYMVVPFAHRYLSCPPRFYRGR